MVPPSSISMSGSVPGCASRQASTSAACSATGASSALATSKAAATWLAWPCVQITARTSRSPTASTTGPARSPGSTTITSSSSPIIQVFTVATTRSIRASMPTCLPGKCLTGATTVLAADLDPDLWQEGFAGSIVGLRAANRAPPPQCSDMAGGHHVLQPRGVPVRLQRMLRVFQRHQPTADHVLQDVIELNLLEEAGARAGGGPDVRLHRGAAERSRDQEVEDVLPLGSRVAVCLIDGGL